MTGLAVILSVCVVVLVACSSKTAPARRRQRPRSLDAHRADRASSGTSGPSPGVTATSVTVGQVDDLSSPIPGLFKGAEDGTKAYFAYINSQGGVNGRRLILDAQDSTFQGGQVATATGTQIRTEFALVGGFSLLDSAEKPLIDIARVPDVGFSLSPGLSTDPYLYSPLPNPENYYPLNLFKYLKKKYPQAIKKVGIIWENATASTTAAETAVESRHEGRGIPDRLRPRRGALRHQLPARHHLHEEQGREDVLLDGAARQLRGHARQAVPAAELHGPQHRGCRLLGASCCPWPAAPPTTCTSSRGTPSTSARTPRPSPPWGCSTSG